MTRYTIVGNGTNHFKLVEDKEGAWMQSAEVLANTKPVPRCETCAHFQQGRDNKSQHGWCLVLLFVTERDFGCIRWKTE